MKSRTIAFALLLGIGSALGLLACTGGSAPVRVSTQTTMITSVQCCDTMYINFQCSSCLGAKASAFGQTLTNHSMFAASFIDTVDCGADTALHKYVGPDSMTVTKSGMWVTAYFSATSPILDSIRVGNHYSVVFRRI